jgi:hypothetical protein
MKCCGFGSRIQCFFDPWIRDRKNPELGSGINIPDPQHWTDYIGNKQRKRKTGAIIQDKKRIGTHHRLRRLLTGASGPTKRGRLSAISC